MKILDKYTLKQIIFGFVLVLASMTTLVWLTQSLRMIDMIVTRGVSAKIFFELTLLVLPNFLQILSPLALFAVALFTLVRMQADKELMVMQAVGMSPMQIMRPVFLMGMVLTILGYVMSLILIPAANTEMREMRWKIKNDISHLMLQEGQFDSFSNGLTLYVRERASDGMIKGIFLYDQKDPNKKVVLAAQEGIVFQESEGIKVVLKNGTRQEYMPQSQKFSILKFDKYTMALSEKENQGVRSRDVRELPMTALWQKTEQDVNGNKPLWRKHKVEFVKRLVQPLYNMTYLFLIIFGVLSGYYNRRGQVGRINLTVWAALIIQSLALAFESMSNKNLWCLILLVLNAFAPVLFFLAWHYKKQISAKMAKFGVGLCLVLWAIPAVALDLKMPNISQNQPVDFEADRVSYQQQGNTVLAEGNVVLKQEGLTMQTEQIRFSRDENKIVVPHEIQMKMADGTVAKSQGGSMSGSLDRIDVGATEMTLYEGSSFGADRMQRVENGDSYLTEAYYTPCNHCETQAPLWKLRAKTIRHDVSARDLIYKNVFFDVKNVPVVYLPYWRMPDFTVKRRSGFLAPGFYSTHEMRRSVTLPFFVNVADNQNLTITPYISYDHVPLGVATYEGLFSKGKLDLQASATQDKNDSRNQGHIRAGFEYDMTDRWKWSGEWSRVSGDTYFRRYRIQGIDDTEPFLTSHLTAERFGNRNYFRARAYSFQSLQDGVQSRTIPTVIPVLDYQYNTMPLAGYGLYGFTALNTALYNTREHFKSNRISVTQGVRMPYVSPVGAAFDLMGQVRADAYAVDTGERLIDEKPQNTSYTTGRIYPNAALTVSYPLTRTGRTSTQTLEPVAMVVAAPNGGNKEKIPNVDSLIFDFDDTNLFSANRFAGYDRVEGGTRVNYGLKWSRFNHSSGRSVSALFGQSYRLSEDELMTDLLGYDSRNFSNYVGRIRYAGEYLTLNYRTRLNQRTFQSEKTEVGLLVGTAPLRVGVDYITRKAYTIRENAYDDRKELYLTVNSQFSRNWSMAGKYRYDLTDKKKPLESGLMLRYDNECTAIIFDASKSFAEDRDYKGSTSFMVKFILKTLGGTK